LPGTLPGVGAYDFFSLLEAPASLTTGSRVPSPPAPPPLLRDFPVLPISRIFLRALCAGCFSVSAVPEARWPLLSFFKCPFFLLCLTLDSQEERPFSEVAPGAIQHKRRLCPPWRSLLGAFFLQDPFPLRAVLMLRSLLHLLLLHLFIPSSPPLVLFALVADLLVALLRQPDRSQISPFVPNTSFYLFRLAPETPPPVILFCWRFLQSLVGFSFLRRRLSFRPLFVRILLLVPYY